MTRVKYADALWSIIQRAPGRCMLRGLDGKQCSGPLQGMHIVGRTNWSLRYNLDNGICGCRSHHAFYTWDENGWRRLIEAHFGEKTKLFGEPKNRERLDYVRITGELENEVVRLYRAGELFNEYSQRDKALIKKIGNKPKGDI